MTDRIDLRLGNGLATISPGEVDSIIIAGMGGILITDILEAGMDVVPQSTGQLVLQPQSETEHLRRYIAENGWKITEEKMLIDAGKYYVVLNVDVTTQDLVISQPWMKYIINADITSYIIMTRSSSIWG